MNTKFASLSFCFLLSAFFVQAQGTPNLMSYQGRVTDAAGVLIGNTSPVNRSVTFKLYSGASGGSALYAETQTVTISGGEFSVLIGNGTGISGSPGPSAPASPTRTLSDVVNAGSYTSLYLGITVDDGTAAADLEISPRQQMVSGAFALRSKMAETVAGGAITNAMLADSTILTAKIAAGAVDSSRILDLSITAGDILNSTITANKLDGNTIGLWTPSGSSIYRNSNVGIGTTDPTAKLQVTAASGANDPTINGIYVYNPVNSANNNAVISTRVAGSSGGNPFLSFDVSGVAGWSAGLDNADAGKFKISSEWNSLANSAKLTIDRGGNVGIGTTAPGQKLDIVGGLNASGTVIAPGYTFNGGGDGDGGMYSTADGLVQFRSNGTERMRIDGVGNVGIATTGTSAKLTIGGTLDGSAKSPWFNVNGGSLPSGAGSEVFLGSFGCTTTNTTSLSISAYRASTGTDWGSTALILGMNVDNSVRPGSWLSIGTSGVGIRTLDQSQGTLNVGGSLTSIGSRSGVTGYARMMYSEGRGGIAFEVYNTSQGGTTNWRSFSFDGDSNIDYYSDRRLKTDIVDAEPMLDRLVKVPFHRFRWKDNAGPDSKHEFGVIAQEVKPLFPDLVTEDDAGVLKVGYGTFATIACKAVQELKVKMDGRVSGLTEDLSTVKEDLSKKIEMKDARISQLEARLSALEKLVQRAK